LIFSFKKSKTNDYVRCKIERLKKASRVRLRLDLLLSYLAAATMSFKAAAQ
jgi:hypothetical protein